MLLSSAAGSSGDESWPFRRCHSQCLRTGCASLAPVTPAAAASPASVQQQCSPLCGSSGGGGGSGVSGAQHPAAPLALRLWRWDCAADCSYLCMWQMEGSRRQAGASRAGAAQLPVQKYHGKWPFVRVLGMQEPASVLFSLLNLAAHAHCLLRFMRLCCGLQGSKGSSAGQAQNGSSDSSGAEPLLGSLYPFSWLWAGYMLLSCNAWLWSAVFHSRDTRLTERLDYFAAAALIFFNLFLSLVRTCRLRWPPAQAAVAVPLLLFLASHIRYMLCVRFDYGYHVQVCVAAGAAQSMLWLLWSLVLNPPHPGRRPLLAFIALVNACMALEILDFPPMLHLLDAHSLWHATTAPLVYLFFRFIQADLTAGWVQAQPGADAAKVKQA